MEALHTPSPTAAPPSLLIHDTQSVDSHPHLAHKPSQWIPGQPRQLLSLADKYHEMTRDLEHARKQLASCSVEMMKRGSPATAPTTFWGRLLGQAQQFFQSQPEDLVDKYRELCQHYEHQVSHLVQEMKQLQDRVDVERRGGEAETGAKGESEATRRSVEGSSVAAASGSPPPPLGWVPNQFFQTGAPFECPLEAQNDLFLGVTEVGNNTLPPWMSFQQELLGSWSQPWDVDLGGLILQESYSVPSAVTVDASTSTLFIATTASDPSQYYASWDLFLVDITNSSNPRLTHDLVLAEYTALSSLTLNGSLLFGLFGGGFAIFDVKDRSNPVVKNKGWSFTTPIYCYVSGNLVVSGSFIFTLCGNTLHAPVYIANVSNLSQPVQVGSISNFSLPARLAFQNSSLFVASSGLLQIVDVSNPKSPQLRGNVSCCGTVVDFEVHGTQGFVSCNTSLQIFDLSNLSEPQMVSQFSGQELGALSVIGSTALVGGGSGLVQLLDLTPNSSQILSSFQMLGGVLDVELIQNLLVVSWLGGFQIFNGSRGVLVGDPPESLDGQVHSLKAQARDSSTAIASTKFSLTLTDVPRPLVTTLVDQSLWPGQYLSLPLETEELFVTPGNSFLGLSIQESTGESTPWVDLHLVPTRRGRLELDGCDGSLAALTEEIVLLACGPLVVVNVSNPREPIVLFATQNFSAVDVSVGENNIVFVANAGNLSAIDLSNLTDPRFVSNYTCGPLPCNFTSVAANGSVLYAGSTASELMIFDVGNVNNPILLWNASYDTYDMYGSIQVLFYSWFVITSTTHYCFYTAWDTRNLTNPVYIWENWCGYITSPHVMMQMAIGGGILYVSTPGFGVSLFNISYQSGSPQALAFIPTPDYLSHIAASGSVVVLTGDSGATFWDTTNVTSARLMATAPGMTGKVLLATNNMAYFGGPFSIMDLGLWRLSLTPKPESVRNYNLNLVATDNLGAQAVHQTFTIRVEGTPQLQGASQLNAEYAMAGEVWNYFLPQGMFSDPNQDTVTFQATLRNGSHLPPWMSFNGISGTFVGLPQVQDAGAYNITIKAMDATGASSANTTFTLNIGVDYAFTLPIVGDQQATTGVPFHFVFPYNQVVVGDGEPLGWIAFQDNFDPLPNWLLFDNESVQFSGTPGPYDTEAWTIRVLNITLKATTSHYAAFTSFNINVGGSSYMTFVTQTGSAIVSVTIVFWVYVFYRYLEYNHRKKYELANHLRTELHLAYYNFGTYSGEVYKTRIGELLTEIERQSPGLYYQLTLSQRQCFAVCLADCIKRQQLVSPAGFLESLWNMVLCYGGWRVQQLDLDDFPGLVRDLAREVIQEWGRVDEESGSSTDRWVWRHEDSCELRVFRAVRCCCCCCCCCCFGRSKERPGRKWTPMNVVQSEGVGIEPLLEKKEQ